ncbi:MAG: hypothetical protein AAF624_03005 [Bacteroidota bacterium]
MGYSHWSHDDYSTRQHVRRQRGVDAFDYDRHVRSTGRYVVHERMNPYGVAFRESRDSVQHPESVPIGVFFDVTGSMGSIPRMLQTKLGALMRTLVARGYVAHPQVLFGAVGDAYTDRVPLQVGQFESGLEMDDDLSRIVIEGGGGGQVHESYELALYFFARHTATDAWDKRRKKGYLFLMGDEMPYDAVRRDQVQALLGDRMEASRPIEHLIAEVQERYHLFFLTVTQGHHGRSPRVQQRWRDLLGERALLLDDPEAVSETIALQVGLVEGTVQDLGHAADDLVAAGFDANAVRTASKAVAKYDATSTFPGVASGTLPPPSGTDGDSGRL